MPNQDTVLHGQIFNYTQFLDSFSGTEDDIQSQYKNLANSLCEKYSGEIKHLSTDSIKVIFDRPANALRFALGIFDRFSQEPRIPYRIGIGQQNSGNPELAFNLQQICPEGSILFPEEIVKAINPNEGFNFLSIGKVLLKGSSEALTINCLVASGLYIPSQNDITEKSRNKNSIAILPFHNTSSEKELDYICEGLAEEVIDTLTKANNIFVTARSSSFLFRKREVSILEISRKLNVNYVLDGSIRKRNDEYRISYQLVDCATGYNILSDNLKADFNELYDCETKISENLLQYFHADTEHASPPTNSSESYVDPQAYSNYLQGKYLSQQWNSDSAGAIKFFQKALDIEPKYAIAYAGMSVCYTHLALNGYGDFRESITKATHYADKAIEVDNSIADGYTAKALASFWMGNWFVPDFEKNITAALAISPCNAEIRMFNGMVFLIKGELKRALSEIELSKQLDPCSSAVNIRLGLVQYLNRNYEDAHNTYLILLKEEVNRTYNILRLACCSLMLKQYSKTLEYLNMSDDNYEYYQMKYGIYLAAYKGLKDQENFFKTKEIIEQLPENDTSTYYNKAVLYKLTGKHELSIQFLEKMLQNPLFYLMFLQYDEFWEDFHEHPLFIELIQSKYKGTGNQLLRINSETKEYIEIKKSDFLYAEAQDNYTMIAYKEKSRLKEHILRATLSFIEDQLKESDTERCHRSYLVNTTAEFEYHKADNKAFLKHANFDISIPVSRGKEKELKKLFMPT